MKKAKFFLILMAFLALFFSCKNSAEDAEDNQSQNQEQTQPQNPSPPSATTVVESVTLSLAKLQIGEGETATITATVNGENLSESDKGVTWASSDETIATVDQSGKVSAKSLGTATITATSKKDKSKSASLDVIIEGEKIVQSTTTEKIIEGTSLAKCEYSYTGGEASIYVYSKSNGLNFYGIKVGENLWNVSDLEAGDISETKTLTSGTVSIEAIASSDKKFSIDANSKSCDNINFTKRLKTNGGGSKSGRCLKISVTGDTQFIFYAISGSSSESRTMVIDVVKKDAQEIQIVRPTSISISESSKTLTITDTNSSPNATLTATISPVNVTSGYDAITWTSSNQNIATVDQNGKVSAISKGTATITASTSNGKTASCTITVKDERSSGEEQTPPSGDEPLGTISATDKPIGFASVGAESPFGGAGGTVVTVSTKAEFKNAIESSGKKIIYVNGMIDLSDGMLPTTAGGSNVALDNFVKTTNSNYSSYDDFKTKYAGACSASTNDKDSKSPESTYGKDLWALNSAYQNKVVIKPKSDKTVIGLGENCGFKGGSINISSVSNIAIRNLTFQDAYDPFPHHEKDDGFNAELDCIVIQGTSQNIWIDHCTLKDTLYVEQVAISGGTSEKWQTFDGLLDIKKDTKNITVSECRFFDHDKTMLIGSSDSDGSNSTRTISLIKNYFENCGQRLPMVRNTQLHALNNYYDANKSHYSQQYAIGARANALIYSEKNYFGSGINYSITGTKDGTKGSAYDTGSTDNSKNKKRSGYFTELSSAPFAPGYTYNAINASEVPSYVKANAGSGKWSVQK